MLIFGFRSVRILALLFPASCLYCLVVHTAVIIELMRDTAIQRITGRPEKRKPEKVPVTIRVPSDIVEALKIEADNVCKHCQKL